MRISNEALASLITDAQGVPMYMGFGSRANVELVGWLTFENPDAKQTLADALRQMADYVESL